MKTQLAASSRHNTNQTWYTGFDYTSTPPSVGNPLGNPTYPGWTSANGPNWVDFLTVNYNDSLLLTYNLAYGGATVDSDLVAPYDPSVLSLKDQINDEFVPGYTGSSPTAPSAPAWKGQDSLFVIWIGINDVGNSWWTDYATLYATIFEEYTGLVDTLYNSGAQNFVFLTVPPTDRSPLMIEQGEYGQEGIKAAIAYWNGLVSDMASTLKADHANEVNVWVYDAAADFSAVLDSPDAFPQTSGLQNTDEYCVDYQK